MKSEIMKKAANQLPVRKFESEKDILLLYELMPTLSDEAILAVYFRFWEQLLIEDIAKILGRTWKQTDLLIENSIQQLRHGFLKNQMSKQPAAA
ncbi:MAG: hypothetical protein ACK5Y2_00855 [Bdellovibrionales bacterium]